MREFQKYGSYYAIIMSAVAFEAFYGNLIQSIVATLVGLISGHIAMKYSIKWSILLHIINNFIFGDLLSYLTKNMSESVQSGIIYVIEGVFLVATIIILLLRRGKIKRIVKEIKIDKKLLGVTLTPVWMLIFLTIQLSLAISEIKKLHI